MKVNVRRWIGRRKERWLLSVSVSVSVAAVKGT